MQKGTADPEAPAARKRAERGLGWRWLDLVYAWQWQCLWPKLEFFNRSRPKASMVKLRVCNSG